MFTNLKFSAAALFAAALLAAAPNAATAQLKIGVVDMARLSKAAPQWQAAQQVLEREFGDRQRFLLGEQERLAHLQQMKPDNPARAAQVKSDLREGMRNFQLKSQEYQSELNRRREEDITRLQEETLEEIRKFAREEGFDLVLTDVAYYGGQVDVTDRVLQRLKATADAP